MAEKKQAKRRLAFGPLDKALAKSGQLTPKALLDQLMVMMLLDGGNPADAELAYRSLKDGFLDWNEVRVTKLRDIEAVLKGDNGNRAASKAALIRAVLTRLFDTQHRLSLDFLAHLDPGRRADAIDKLQVVDPWVSEMFLFVVDRMPAVADESAPESVAGDSEIDAAWLKLCQDVLTHKSRPKKKTKKGKKAKAKATVDSPSESDPKSIKDVTVSARPVVIKLPSPKARGARRNAHAGSRQDKKTTVLRPKASRAEQTKKLVEKQEARRKTALVLEKSQVAAGDKPPSATSTKLPKDMSKKPASKTPSTVKKVAASSKSSATKAASAKAKAESTRTGGSKQQAPKTKAKPKSKPTTEPKPKAEAKSKPKGEAKSKPKAEAKPKLKGESKPKPKGEPKSKLKAESKPKPKAVSSKKAPASETRKQPAGGGAVKKTPTSSNAKSAATASQKSSGTPTKRMLAAPKKAKVSGAKSGSPKTPVKPSSKTARPAKKVRGRSSAPKKKS